MEFFDIHTHLLYGVDDGADSIETALEMLNNAVASDVAALALTPHCNHPALVRDNYNTSDIAERFEKLKAAAQDIPIKIYLGAEAHVTKDFPSILDKGVIPTINGTKYLLTEFAENVEIGYCEYMLKEIISRGFIPLIAHPERYDAVCADPKAVLDWLDMGCHLQLTSAGITGGFGKKVKATSDILLKNDLVCCVASDAHGIKTRTNLLTDVYSYLSLYYGKQYAGIIMRDNPECIITGGSL